MDVVKLLNKAIKKRGVSLFLLSRLIPHVGSFFFILMHLVWFKLGCRMAQVRDSCQQHFIYMCLLSFISGL